MNVSRRSFLLGGAAAIGAASVGVGRIVTIAPPDTGWVECVGQYVSRLEYPELFQVLGYSYSTPGPRVGYQERMFRLPDMRGRFTAIDNDGSSLHEVVACSYRIAAKPEAGVPIGTVSTFVNYQHTL